MQTWEIILNGKLWRTISSERKPAMNLIIEMIDSERFNKNTNPETNLDQEFRLDLGSEILVRAKT